MATETLILQHPVHVYNSENSDLGNRIMSVKGANSYVISDILTLAPTFVLAVQGSNLTNRTQKNPLGIVGGWISMIVDGTIRNVEVPVEDSRAYDFRVRGVSKYGAVSAWDTFEDHKVAKNPPTPDPITGLTASGRMAGVDFYWTRSDGVYFHHYSYRLQVEADGWSGWFDTYATRVQRMLTSTEKDSNGGDANIQIEVKVVDNWLQESTAETANADCLNLNIDATDIDDMGELSTEFTDVPVIQGLTITNNSPASGYVTWSACTVYFNGTTYSISTAFSKSKYIIWKDLISAFDSQDDHPTLYSNADPSSAMITVNDITLASTVVLMVNNVTNQNAWHTDTSSTGAYIRIDVGSGNSKDYLKCRIFCGSAGATANYSIQYSDDASSWSDAATDFIPSASGWNEKSWSTAGAHRYWQLYLTNIPGSGPWSTELEFYVTSTWKPQEDFIIATNTSGVHQKAWNAIANEVIGSAWIKDLAVTTAKIDTLAVTNAKINDLDATKINAGYLSADRIDTGTIVVAKLNADATNRMFTDSTTKTNIEGWKHASDVTKIDGGDIYTGSVTATQITVANLAALNANCGAITAGTLSSSDYAVAAGIRLDLGNKFLKMGGSNVTAAGAAAGVFLGLDTSYKFYVGDGSNKYLKYDGTDVTISGADITLKSGNGITVESGGDLTFQSASGTSSVIQFIGDSRTFSLGIDFDRDRLALYSDTDKTGQWYAGYNFNNGYQRFNDIFIACSDDLSVRSYDDTTELGLYCDNGDAYLRLNATDASNSAYLFVRTTPTVEVRPCLSFGVTLAAASAPNNSIYVDSGDGKLYFKNSGGASNALY